MNSRPRGLRSAGFAYLNPPSQISLTDSHSRDFGFFKVFFFFFFPGFRLLLCVLGLGLLLFQQLGVITVLVRSLLLCQEQRKLIGISVANGCASCSVSRGVFSGRNLVEFLF